MRGMRNLLVHLLSEIGNGRALANARRERDEMQQVLACVDELGRRLASAPVAPVVATAA
jgi:hypothetical protein